MMIAYFRTDSSIQIGSGHVMRCLVLAERYVDAGFRVEFICRDIEGNMIEYIQRKGIRCHVLPAVTVGDMLDRYENWLTVTQERDANDTVAILKSYNDEYNEIPDIIIEDSYALDEKWEQIVRPYVKEIFVIDDLANRKHDCDYLLDQDSYINKETRYNGLVPDKCKLLLGHEFALLRKEFYTIKRHLGKRNGKVKRILVFFGGSDLTNETEKTIKALLGMELHGINVDVIVGQGNVRKERIESICLENGDFSYYCQVENMAAMMAEADLAIGAGGITLWERFFLELPSIVIAVADNQVKICEDCAKQGMIDYLGESKCVTESMIKDGLLKYI